MSRHTQPGRFAALLLSAMMVCQPMFASGTTAASASGAPTPPSSSSPSKPVKKPAARKTTGVPTFADSERDDVTQFDDPVVRDAAVHALGRYNGSVVAIDPTTGRILTIVNQKLAFSAGFIPCSTIKPTIALAALEESVITHDSMIKVAPRKYMNLTEAMAHSNNPFFEELGRRMGFETVEKYAQRLGLGELAGINIPEEQAGVLPANPPARGGVARMSSFGEGIQITPLELGSLVAALANGGTMYYLQYPRSAEAQRDFSPMVKRELGIGPYLSDLREGMTAAVLYGTARSSYWDREGEQPLGKTGTCNDAASRLGWFVSYADEEHPKIALVVLVRGRSRTVQGPFAAEIAGRIYHTLKTQNFFAAEGPRPSPTTLTAMAAPREK
ncbi:MAG: penicillin-binding transpeptidase domain-containing protein [Candidatus Acidiferrales bacterium]